MQAAVESLASAVKQTAVGAEAGANQPPTAGDADTGTAVDAEGADFEETINKAVLSFDEFAALQARRTLIDSAGIDAQLYWNYPRRWRVGIFGISLCNLQKDDLSAFLEFEVGSNRQEFRISLNSTKAVKVAALGSVGYRRRTYLIHPVSKDRRKPSKIDLNIQYEWRGSYEQLNSHRLIINAWKHSGSGLNLLEGTFGESLISFVNSSVHVSRELYKLSSGQRIPRCLSCFQLLIQEIFDFHLEFIEWGVKLQARSSGLNVIAKRGSVASVVLERSGDSSLEKPHSWLLDIRGLKSLGGKNIHSQRIRTTRSPTWGFLGTMHYQGTLMELEESACEICLIRGPFGRAQEYAKAYIQFRGLLQRDQFSARLRLIQSDKATDLDSELIVSGRVHISREPLYAQQGQFLTLKTGRTSKSTDPLFLIVRLKSIDRVFTRDGNSIVNAQVSVSYRTETRLSRIIPHTSSPDFDEDIPIPVYYNDITELIKSTSPAADEIVISVWSVYELKTEHIGQVSFTVWDLIYGATGELRPLEKKQIFDVEEMHLRNVMVRCLEMKEALSLSFESEKAPTITFEAFFSRETPELVFRPSPAKPDLRPITAKFREDVQTANAAANALIRSLPKSLARNFELEHADNRRRSLLLPQFLSKVIPPKGVTNPRAAFMFVRSIPFVDPGGDPAQPWELPTFLLMTKFGSPAGHALLLASMFLGLNLQPFVVVAQSRRTNASILLVLTVGVDELSSDPVVRLWDLASTKCIDVSSQISDRARFREAVRRTGPTRKEIVQVKRFWGLFTTKETVEVDDFSQSPGVGARARPSERFLSRGGSAGDGGGGLDEMMGSVNMIFDHVNIWINKQTDPQASKTLFDIWDSELWHRVLPADIILEPPYTPPVFGAAMSEGKAESLQKRVKANLMFEIALLRSGRNLNCTWQTSSVLDRFLAEGSQLQYLSDTCLEEEEVLYASQLVEWRKALESKVPPNWRLALVVISTPYLSVKEICGKVFRAAPTIIEERSRLVTFALHVKFQRFPASLGVFYLTLLSCSQISDNEKRMMLFERTRKEHLRRVLLTDGTVAPQRDEKDGDEVDEEAEEPEEEEAVPVFRVEEETEAPDNVDWEQVYTDTRELAPEHFDELKQQYMGEGYTEEDSKYWAAYHINQILCEEHDTPPRENGSGADSG